MAYDGGASGGDRSVHLPRVSAVKNRQPASKQITAEQILRESRALQADAIKAPVVKISDPEELKEYHLKKRKEFEDDVRRVGRWNPTVFVKYAQWEEQQKDFRRARSVWERALEYFSRNTSIWLKYVEMEMRHRFVNHARNVWDRAVGLLPRVDQLWYKYAHMEEMLGNVAGARQVMERWMAWEPDHHGWSAFVKLELRYGEVDRARGVYERYVRCIPSVQAWTRFAAFEADAARDLPAARRCYERALDALADADSQGDVVLAFAAFEAKAGEAARARAIYRHALDTLTGAAQRRAHEAHVRFEKAAGEGGSRGVDAAVAAERRLHYEARVRASPRDYDAWFDFARLEEAAGEPSRVREVYERAVACVPPADDKRYWRRYVYLWIRYALWEEAVAGDRARARAVYAAALGLVPHARFTFAKLWILAAQAHLRARDLSAARRLLGQALGRCPKDKLFRAYVEMELSLGCVDRCRALYEKYVQWAPGSAAAWSRWAQLEAELGEADRARALFELGLAQRPLDAPELLWKAYIDAEAELGEVGRARELYERLLELTGHVKVWLSFAAFEAAQEGGAEGARGVYGRAFEQLRSRQPEAKEEAVMLLEAWKAWEAAQGEGEGVAEVDKRMPRRVKRRRPIMLEDGSAGAGVEEYYDYVFPDEAAAAPNLKILQAALKWKRQQQETA